MPAHAQSPVTYQYVYDDSGRVTEAIDSSGNALQYVYDAAGNLTAIQRMTGVQIAITGASTQFGTAGQQVTFTGLNIGDCNPIVTFNGVAAPVVSSTTNSVTVTIPTGATSGPVTITNCHGTATSTFTFIIGGVIVTPPSANLNPGETVQFSAAVLPAGSDQTVTWSVDGIVGGNGAVGTITATGLYTSPPAAVGSVDVRATSVAQPTLYGDAQVSIVSPLTGYEAFSPGVSVRLGPGTVLADSTALYVFSPGVSVRLGASGTGGTGGGGTGGAGGTAGTVYIFSPGVSIRLGTTGTGTAGAGTLYILGLPVSVTLGAASASAVRPPRPLALNPGISVQRLAPTMGDASAVLNVANPGVSLPKGPPLTSTLPTMLSTVTALSPSRIAPGASGVVTVAGTHLEGARAIAFLDDAGQPDPRIRIENAVIAPDGRAMTLHLSVSRQALPGRRRVVVWTLPPGKSATP